MGKSLSRQVIVEQGTDLFLGNRITGVVGSEEDVVVLSLNVLKTYKNFEINGSASRHTDWRVLQVNDATTTELWTFETGPGKFSHYMCFRSVNVTSGSVGTQQIKLVATQVQGGPTELRGIIGVFEKA